MVNKIKIKNFSYILFFLGTVFIFVVLWSLNTRRLLKAPAAEQPSVAVSGLNENSFRVEVAEEEKVINFEDGFFGTGTYDNPSYLIDTHFLPDNKIY